VRSLRRDDLAVFRAKIGAVMRFRVKRFEELTVDELYDLLRLRAEIFVVEQECAYQDLDGLDRASTHLLGTKQGRLEAYARWHPEGEQVRLGRIVTGPRVRGRGHGRRLVIEALRRIAAEHPGRPVLIHAQAHLEGFYQDLGFETRGEPFDEDGIPHVSMMRTTSAGPVADPGCRREGPAVR
jgi:ElaA protein